MKPIYPPSNGYFLQTWLYSWPSFLFIAKISIIHHWIGKKKQETNVFNQKFESAFFRRAILLNHKPFPSRIFHQQKKNQKLNETNSAKRTELNGKLTVCLSSVPRNKYTNKLLMKNTLLNENVNNRLFCPKIPHRW